MSELIVRSKIYIRKFDKRNSQVVSYENRTLTSSWLFQAVCDFSLAAECFDRSINWLEMDHEDFSPVIFYKAMNHIQFPYDSEIGEHAQ